MQPVEGELSVWKALDWSYVLNNSSLSVKEAKKQLSDPISWSV